MATPSLAEKLTPLQREIYVVDGLGLDLLVSMRIVTQKVGFFVGQQRYLEERKKIMRILEEADAEESA